MAYGLPALYAIPVYTFHAFVASGPSRDTALRPRVPRPKGIYYNDDTHSGESRGLLDTPRLCVQTRDTSHSRTSILLSSGFITPQLS